MKFIITVIIVVGLAMGGWQIYLYWGTFNKPAAATRSIAPVPTQAGGSAAVSGDQLPGLPANLQPALDAARQQGASGLRDFLAAHSKEIADPRLASIELDYAVLVLPSDTSDARSVFAGVKKRLHPDSPAYERMKRLEKTYDQPVGQ